MATYQEYKDWRDLKALSEINLPKELDAGMKRQHVAAAKYAVSGIDNAAPKPTLMQKMRYFLSNLSFKRPDVYGKAEHYYNSLNKSTTSIAEQF